jgi:hypothetical protein
MRWIELGILAEIVDRSGTIRKTAGCSIVGRFQFQARLSRLIEIVQAAENSDQPWVNLYRDNHEFQHNLDEVLRLNCLAAEWFTAEQLELLIFGADGEPGDLVKINSPKVQNSDSSDKPQTLGECISCLAGDLEAAIKLATELPAQVAFDLNAAQNFNSLTDEQKAEKEKAETIAQIRAGNDLNTLWGTLGETD